MITELDRVALAVDLPAAGLQAGDIGVVVHAYRDGAAFEVEFMSLAGDTLTVETLEHGQVRPLGQREIAHARPLDAVASWPTSR